MAKKDVEEFVCRPYCSFYREGEKEELICNGARLLEILFSTGALSPCVLIDIEEGSALSLAEYDRLKEIVCRACPFVAEDCDFRSETPPPRRRAVRRLYPALFPGGKRDSFHGEAGGDRP